MDWLFDTKKDESNLAKHGINLSLARLLDGEDALSWIDARKDYGEIRHISLVPLKQRLYCVVYVDNKFTRRVISLRKANNREINRYEKENN